MSKVKEYYFDALTSRDALSGVNLWYTSYQKPKTTLTGTLGKIDTASQQRYNVSSKTHPSSKDLRF
jgi:hypothetical protein